MVGRRSPGYDSAAYGEGIPAKRAGLTPAQQEALKVLADGKEHETHKRSSGANRRVNFLAADSLRKMGLVSFQFGYTSKVRITDAGREKLAELGAQ